VKDKEPEEKRGRIVGRVLPAAIRLWLRSQAEQIESLTIDLSGRDRDLLSGYVPGISLKAQQAIYQGIHIGRLELAAEDIRINIGQVVRGKPLRLMKAFPVCGEVALTEADLNASLTSPLLAQGLSEFWRSLLKTPSVVTSVEARYGSLPMHAEITVSEASARLKGNRLGLSFYPQAPDCKRAKQPVILATGLTAAGGNCLQLLSPQWIENLADVDDVTKGEPVEALQDFQWNLGSDTAIELLLVQSEHLIFAGQIMVNP